jgi:hypothetical protein
MQYSQDEINAFCSQGGIYDNHSMSKKGFEIEESVNHNTNRQEFIELLVVNPFANDINIFYSLIQDGLVSIKLYNTIGNVIFESKLSNNTKGSYSEIIDVSYLNIPDGLYVIEFNSLESNAKRIKLLKTH